MTSYEKNYFKGTRGARKPIILYVIIFGCLIMGCMYLFSSCSFMESEVNELVGSITGNTYEASFYSNDGELFMTMSGEKIDLESNIVDEPTYNSSDGWGYTETMSSVVTILIDGKEVQNCGSTAIFAEKGLKPDVEFTGINSIDSTAKGIGSNTIVAGVVNKYKNLFGKSRIAVIQSQLGNPICAFSGDKVYWKVCQDLPKTTKLEIDGHALYIHRANFQIIDKSLLN